MKGPAWVGSAHFEEAFASLVAGRLAHQVFEQAQTEATPLAFGLHRDIQQVRLVEDDLDDAMADLLATLEHQPAMVVLQAFAEDATGPWVAEGGIFDFQHGIEVRLGHRAEGNRIAH